MKINKSYLDNKNLWENKDYILPKYNIQQVVENTKNEPTWIHFGAGNIFRAFHAKLAQTLINSGETDKGIIVAEGFDYEIINKIYRPHDNLNVLVTLKGDGNIEKEIVASITDALILDSEDEEEFNKLKEIFIKDSLQLATFTVTEKGYAIKNARGEIFPPVEYDFKNGFKKPISYMGKVTALLYERFLNGKKPIALVSTDNCSHNGEKLSNAVLTYASNWVENGFADKDFIDYITNKDLVSFPWTMIDKITPRPDNQIEEILINDGVEDTGVLVTAKSTYIAPFVNAEECEYLVVEDEFPNGRPNLEKAGVLFTNRETVEKVEKMKVCTCLNPLHTALAVFGCLLGYDKICDEMKDEDLKELVEIIGYKEGLIVVTDPKIINPKEFLDNVLNERLINPFMPDTPWRIATDTSQKLSIRFGETIKAYQKSKTLDTKDLKCIPLVFAAWLRYLMGVNDNGKTYEVSFDPIIDTIKPYIDKLEIGKVNNIEEVLKPILSNSTIFGINLYEVDLAKKVCDNLSEMILNFGNVRKVLQKTLKEEVK